MATNDLRLYRVIMRDGSAGLYDALSIDEAKAAAFAVALRATRGVAMSAGERRLALGVSYVEDVTDDG